MRVHRHYFFYKLIHFAITEVTFPKLHLIIYISTDDDRHRKTNHKKIMENIICPPLNIIPFSIQ